mgnify:CR=1 FL=1
MKKRLLHSHLTQSSFVKLIQAYTVILTVMIVGATAVFIWVNVHNYESEVRQAENSVTARVTDAVSRNQTLVSDFATSIVSGVDNLTNLEKYFSTDLSTYADYAIDQSIASGKYFFWPTETRQFLLQNPEVTKLTLRLLDQKQVFVATQANSGGRLVASKNVHGGQTVDASLINQYTLTPVGVLSASFNQHSLTKQIAAIKATAPMQIAVVSDNNAQTFYYRGSGVSAADAKLFKHALVANEVDQLNGYAISTHLLTNGQQIIEVTNKHTQHNLVIWRVLPLMLLGLMVLLALSGILWLIFSRYQRQLHAIVDTVSAVSAGDLEARATIEPNPTDLNVLASGINAMLEEIHAHIYTIYQLRIAQQEANMKALQAQINPHFMSNTMEYIRMAAIDADQPELAKVVYSFAALLRNNTDFSPRTTLKRELDFIEKYVFLYQVRFPDRLAYQITVAPEVMDLQLPKFSLQPLVENYFVHGVDFARQDNAIHIKASQVNERVVITIVNNGRPLAPAAVAALNARIRQPLESTQQTSIGLQNVYSRLHDYFGDGFQMVLSSNGDSGVQVTLELPNSGGKTNAASLDR